MTSKTEANVPKGTQALKTFAATVRDMSHLGTLLQALPKIVRELMDANPEANELRHLQQHKFLDWPIIQDNLYTGITDKTVVFRVIEAFRLYVASVVHDSLKHGLEAASAEGASLREVSRVIEAQLSQGLPTLTSYLSDVLGRPFVIEGHSYMEALSAIAVRNAEAYNAGGIDEEFVKELGRKDVTVGGIFRVDTANVLDWLDALGDVAATIDAEFVDRFGLRTVELFPPAVVH